MMDWQKYFRFSSLGGIVRPLAAASLALGCYASAHAHSSSPTDATALPGEEVIAGVEALGIPAPTMAPASGAEAEGPFPKLIITNVNVIDGTGAPAYGPVDIEIVNDRIVHIRAIGGTRAIDTGGAQRSPDVRVIDGNGGYILPGFVNSHDHIGTPTHVYGGQLTSAEYVFKLLLAHGITSVRDTGSLMGLRWTMRHRDLSEGNTISAPRIFAYALFPEDTATPAQAIEWIRAVHDAGADGVKFLGASPEVFNAAIAEVNRLDMGSAYHHSQLAVTRQNALDTARLGLRSIEHWYGLPEAMFRDQTVQNYPSAYNYNNEQDRFRQAGRLWAQSAAPGSQVWRETISELVESGVTLNPTMVVYEAARDLSRAKTLPWHAQYTMPYAWQSWQPNPSVHGSFFFNWKSEDEIAWRENYRIWMRFLNDFKNAGGRVAVGEDAGFLYALYGFSYVRELELLQEAGFHPLETIKAATLNGAELLRLDQDLGTVAIGKKADLVLVQENPLDNFKVLYGTGSERFDFETGKVEPSTGIRYTIKDGVVYDAKLMLSQVRDMVEAQKQAQ